jgi:hypothetical protein
MSSAVRRANPSAGGELAVRVRGEYREMPGLALTMQQAQRLWALDRLTCESVFEELVAARFLRRTTAGRYVRADNGEVRVAAASR